MTNWNDFTAALRAACPDLELRQDEPMSKHTSFRIGGPAAVMALPSTQAQAQAAVRFAAREGVTPFFMGNGSDLLVSDAGYDGFIVKSALDGIARKGNTLTAGSAVSLARLAVFACDAGLAGSEFAHGIPGTVGGGVTMNAGAYGGELAQVLSDITFLDSAGERVVRPASACELTYRHSAFSDGKRLILSASVDLQPGDPTEIRARMNELMERRKDKQPLEWPSGGSTFKRPEGHFAAALIEQCGLKGASVGGAQVSEKHAGFLINRGGATCADMLALIERVRRAVLERTGVELELEVKLLGV